MPTVLDFQRLRETLLPEWTKPENASVFDPFYRAPIRTIIKALGLDDPQQVMALGTPLETGQMAGGALEAIGKRFPRFAQALKVYHGSPHDFERFDASKIGTGEGAQAYGHGLYFAESPEVAESYSQQLGGAKRLGEPVKYAGNEYPPGTTQHRLLLDVNDVGKEKAIGRLKADIRFNESYAPDQANLQKSYLEWLESVDPASVSVTKGKTYEVAIHADPEHFLDWDKPLSQQTSPAFLDLVRDGLKKAGYLRPEDNGPRQLTSALKAWQMERGGMAETTMEALLGGRGGLLGSTPEEVAQNLNKAGIPGLKYYDQASRVRGKGTRNYVVFPGNENLIEILKKYGIAATTGVGVAGGLASQEGR